MSHPHPGDGLEIASLSKGLELLHTAADHGRVMEIVRRAARRLTGADGASFILRDGDKCFYADEEAISPLWKGRRFPMEKCLSGWVMINAQSIVLENIYADPRVLWEAYHPTFVKSLALVPIGRSQPVGAVGAYWAIRHTATVDQMQTLQALADGASVALLRSMSRPPF